MSKQTPSVLITGACGDIGRSLAARFAAAGYRLLLCDIVAPEEAESQLAACRKMSPAVVYGRVDITDQESFQAFINNGVAELGGLDVCVANAGIVQRGRLLDLELDAWQRTIEVNLTGSFLTARLAARQMIARNQPGQIIFISSWVQDAPIENIGAYCASKGGMKMLAKCLALELGANAIRVNLVAPGWIDAGLTGANLIANPELRESIEGRISLGRLATADELARAVFLLCSDDASYIHGATLLVDGGSSLCPRK
jgi:glucose 1-dehydrogenase